MSLPFRHPTTILVAGPTGCGKTEFLVQFLQNKALQPFPERIVWIYSEWQGAYDRILALHLGRTRVSFVKDFDDSLYDSINPKTRNLVVLDDQMESDSTRQRGGSVLSKFFSQGSHHRNLTVVYIVQNLFHQAKAMRTISLNTHYLVLFKNPRDKSQVRTLASQMYPNRMNFLLSAYEDATSVPFGYLLLDLRPDTPDDLRVRTNVFDSRNQVVYLPSI